MPSRVSPILNPSWNRNRSDIYLHSHQWVAPQTNGKDGWYECENKVLWMKLYQIMLQTHHANNRKLMGSVFANIWECRHVPGILKWWDTFPLPHHKSRYEDNRLITVLYATRQTPNITLEESKTGNCLLFCLQLWKSLSADQDQKLRGSRGFLWNIYQITCHHSVQMKPLLETPSVDIAFLSLECLLFGPSVCIYFFFLWAFGMLSFDAIQGKIIYIYI